MVDPFTQREIAARDRESYLRSCFNRSSGSSGGVSGSGSAPKLQVTASRPSAVSLWLL